jgi:hypothetical protein
LTTSSGESIDWRTSFYIDAAMVTEPTCSILGCGGSAGLPPGNLVGVFFRQAPS